MGYAYMSISLFALSNALYNFKSVEDFISQLDLPADVTVEKTWMSPNTFEPAGLVAQLVLLKSAEFMAETPELAMKEPSLTVRMKESA